MSQLSGREGERRAESAPVSAPPRPLLPPPHAKRVAQINFIERLRDLPVIFLGFYHR
jgi:hypothetical protein